MHKNIAKENKVKLLQILLITTFPTFAEKYFLTSEIVIICQSSRTQNNYCNYVLSTFRLNHVCTSNGLKL